MGVKWGTRTETTGRYERGDTMNQTAAVATPARGDQKTYSVTFPDGAIFVAETWIALEDALMRDLWMPSEPAEFRRVMNARSKVWSGRRLNLEARAELFFLELEKSGMLTINNNNGGK